MAEPLYTQRPTLHPRGFASGIVLPYGLRSAEVKAALDDLYDFLHNVNTFLISRGWDRLEETLSPATFSGLISEMVVSGVAKRSATLTVNQFHNGRPDLVPTGVYPNEAVQRGDEGIEVKASRNDGSWQGHNAENGWIMVFQYSVDTKTQPVAARPPTKFQRVLIAQLEAGDWSFSGRGEGSRRTPTASILRSGVSKLAANPVYLDPDYRAPGTANKGA